MHRSSVTNPGRRFLSRLAGLALVLTGVAFVLAGPASANDRAVSVLCTDHTTGAWEVSVTFSSIEVKPDRPVTVTLGAAHAVLTQVGPDGRVTLRQPYPGTRSHAEVIWSIVRLDYQMMGKLELTQPADCRETTTTTAPPTTTVTTAGTVPSSTTPVPPITQPVRAHAAPPTTITPQVEAEHVTATLPVTGGLSLPLVGLGAVAIAGGLLLVRSSRRRASDPA